MSMKISGNTNNKNLYLIAPKLSVFSRTSLDLHRHLACLTNSRKRRVPTDRQNYGVTADHQHNSGVSIAYHGVSTEHQITQGSLPTTMQKSGVSTDHLPLLLL